MTAQFILGFMSGGVVGAWVTYLAFDWLHPEVRAQEREVLFPLSARRSCPPCNEDCREGDDCPLRKKKED